MNNKMRLALAILAIGLIIASSFVSLAASQSIATRTITETTTKYTTTTTTITTGTKTLTMTIKHTHTDYITKTRVITRTKTFTLTKTITATTTLTRTETLKKPSVSFYPEKEVIEKPYKIIFHLRLTGGASAKYFVEVWILNPERQILKIKDFVLYYDGVNYEDIIRWNPSDGIPGTYFALLVMRNSGGDIIDYKGIMFYLDDPDVSFVQAIEINDIKMIHVHLQRFRVTYPSGVIEAIPRELLLKAFRLDIVGISIEAIKLLFDKVSSASRGLVSPTNPYDATILLVPKPIFNTYLGYVSEANPVNVPDEEIKEFLMNLCISELIKMLIKIPIPEFPIPIEKFVVIDETTYREIFSEKPYTILPMPREIRAEYLTRPASEYELGRTIGFYVRLIDPTTEQPLTTNDVDIRLVAGPVNVKQTSFALPAFQNYNGDGIYRIEIDPATVETIYRSYFGASEYLIYFVAVAPGYIGVSSGVQVKITSEEAFADINRLSWDSSPRSISFSEETSISVSFNAVPRISGGGFMNVKVEILRKTFFNLLTIKITEREAKIGNNQLVIRLKGEDIADKFLLWPIPGDYPIYAKIILSYIPPETSQELKISEETFPITISVR